MENLKETQFLESINVLGQLAWPMQKLLNSFCTKPYLIRCLPGNDNDVVDKDGLRHQFLGAGVVGTNSFSEF
jgi:hypothetical protein